MFSLRMFFNIFTVCIFDDHLNCCHKTHLLFFIKSDLQRRLQNFFSNFGKMYILAKSINTYLRFKNLGVW